MKEGTYDLEEHMYGNRRMRTLSSAGVSLFSRRCTVPSGAFSIRKSKNEILDAYLGSCVGITICDRGAGVGGLIHLLLPAPTSRDPHFQPESNAVTGLPLFMEALCNAGASKDRMEACLAGGALVGPVSRTDLMLDIGGRTADAAVTILGAEKITIVKSEVGGYFASRLSLDLQSLESSIEPIGLPTFPSLNPDIQCPTTAQIEAAMKTLLPIPQIALKIIRMINDDAYNMTDLAGEVLQDQIISAKVLKLCNTAYLNSHLGLESVDRALLMLGEKRLLQMVMSSSVEDFLSQGDRGYSLCKGGLFKHALGTAIASEKLSRLSGRCSPDVAYTAGLVHDIGKVVLDQFIHASYPLFYRQTQMEEIDLIPAELQLFGVTHTDAGSRLAERWALPESLAEVIRWHHAPERATVNPELTHIVYLADLIMSRFVVGQEIERLNTDALASRLARLGLESRRFPAILEEVCHAVFDVNLFRERLGARAMLFV
jgi:putative nucleotidyltransferase with HDIG domain